ncbi:hypothetical protein PG997_006725 [Apiospora hydei]|uniref:Glycoside hydrolase family 43 protein n=1 Tax=Apiospora hydei TaxID=1337664 RepID=A0ABR1WPJ8_9PEZI
MWMPALSILLTLSGAVQPASTDPVGLPKLPFATDKRADTGLVGYLGCSSWALIPMSISTKATGTIRPHSEPSIEANPLSGRREAPVVSVIRPSYREVAKKRARDAQRTGSRGIFVWESTDLVNWGNERLVVVEDSTAGMVWAPEAIWDASEEQYLVHWASKFYSTSDTRHTGTPSAIRIRYAHTRDFRTFTAPQTYIDRSPTSIIDLDILPLYPDADNQQYVRFMKDESRKTVFMEYSTTGLFGNWTRAGGSSGTIASQVEGPAAYRNNLGRARCTYCWTSTASSGDLRDNRWTASSRSGFPSNLRHGSVLPINRTLFSALSEKWSLYYM